MAERSARELNEILTGAEDAQQVMAGTIELQVAALDLGGLLRSVVERVTPGAQAREIALDCETPAECRQVLCDAARLRHVDRVLEKDDGIVVGVGDRAATERLGGARQGHRGRRVGQRIHLARLAHVPVLTELAGEIAAGRPEGEHRSARQEMVERLLFDRIDAEPRGAPVRGEHYLILCAATRETDAALTFVQPAIARAQIALHAPIVEAAPPAARMQRTGPGVVASSSPGVRIARRHLNFSTV